MNDSTGDVPLPGATLPAHARFAGRAPSAVEDSAAAVRHDAARRPDLRARRGCAVVEAALVDAPAAADLFRADSAVETRTAAVGYGPARGAGGRARRRGAPGSLRLRGCIRILERASDVERGPAAATDGNRGERQGDRDGGGVHGEPPPPAPRRECPEDFGLESGSTHRHIRLNSNEIS